MTKVYRPYAEGKKAIPKFLEPGSRVAIVAPAGRVFAEELDFALHWMHTKSWHAVVDENCYKQFDFGYRYAGEINQRLSSFQAVLDSEDIDAIWCARGGYGCIHFVDDLDMTRFLQRPKWLIGYSDITVLHNKLNNMGICTAHAVTGKRISAMQSVLVYDSMHALVSGNLQDFTWGYQSRNRLGTARGVLMGGNLSLLYSQLGSQTALQEDEIVLFIEDWKENWYHLDRMLMAMKRSGLWQRLKGVIVGSFTQMDLSEENEQYSHDFDDMSERIIAQHLLDLQIPIAFACPAGHIDNNLPLMLGAEVELVASEKESRLSYLLL